MGAIAEYLLSVSGAALIGSIVLHLLTKQNASAAIGKMLVALFVALTVLTPIAQVRLSDITKLVPDFSADAEQAVASGEKSFREAMKECISQRLETYILEKAEALGVTLQVELVLSEDTIPVPISVRLQGSVSPYAKTRIQSILQDELGIQKENQIWI